MRQTQAVKQRTQAQQKRKAAQAANTHERQARLAAARLLHGETSLNQVLTHAPASRRSPVTRSRAVTPPGAALRWLEQGFDADLDALRVHHDAPAAQFAASEGAQAVTAGRHIYFAEGYYQPDTAEGRRLLAHETAHALQQTGRVGPDGTVTVTDSVGSAAPQRETLEWAAARVLYQEEAAAGTPAVRSSLDTMIAEIERLVGRDALLSPSLGAGVETAGVNNMAAFEQRVLAGEFNASEPLARSLLVDTLKLLGRFDGAAYLLTQDPTLLTIAPVLDFVVYVRDHRDYGYNWFSAMFSRIPEINSLFPDRYLEAIWRYLMNPARRPIGSNDVATLTRDFEANYQSTFRTVLFKTNERVRGAYAFLETLNTDLQRILGEFNTRISGMPVAIGRLEASRAFVRLAEGWATHEHRVFRDLSPQVAAIARRAAEYWERASTLYQDALGDAEVTFYGGRSTPHSVAPPDPNAPLPTTETLATGSSAAPVTAQAPPEVLRDSAFSAFVTAANAGLTALLRTENSEVPDARAYQAEVTRLRESLTASRTALGERMFTIFRRRDMADAAHFDSAVWLGAAQAYIDGMLALLSRYDFDRDLQFWLAHGRDDIRLYHRYEAALYANTLAHMASVPALTTLSDSIRQGSDLGRSYLLLIGDWQEDTTPLTGGRYLTRDLNSGAVVRGTGLTGGQLDRLYYLTNQVALNAILRRMLSVPPADLSTEQYGLIQRALHETRDAAPMPKRWTINPFLIVWNASDAGVPERANMSALIENHPRYNELLDVEGHRAQDNIKPLERINRVYVWFLPTFERVTEYLNGIPGLGDTITNELGLTPTPETLLDLLDQMWQNAVAGGHAELDALAFEDIRTDVTDALNRDIPAAEQLRDALFRQATTRDRRVTSAHIIPMLTTYAADPRVNNYVLPIRVIELIDRLNQDIRPDTLDERRPQMAALILTIAPNLREAFVRQDAFDRFVGIEIIERRYDIITGLYGYIQRTLTFLRTEGAADQLAPVLDSSESAAGLLAAAAEPLRILINRFDQVIGEVQRQSGFRTNAQANALERVGSSRPLALNSPFMLHGSVVRITAIHTDFLFHPSYGRGTDAYHPAILTHLDGSALSPDQQLLTYQFDGMDETVTLSTNTDEEVLEDFSHVITMELIVRGLEELAEYIRLFVEVGVDVAAAFIPGAPIAITMAQFIQFVAIELPNIREEILNDPLALVQELEQFISPALRAQMIENLWMWLLLRGDLPFAERLEARSRRSPRRPAAAPRPSVRTGRFARLAAFARSVISRILNAFLNLRQRVRIGFARARRTVVRYPLLRRMLGALPVFLEAAEMVAEIGTDTITDIVSDVAGGGGIEAINTSFRETLDELFRGLNGLEVPADILPLELVVDVIIEKFLASLRGVRGTTIRTFLNVTGLRTVFSDFIAQTLREQGLDPNILWRETIRGDVQALLEESRTELIGGINNLLLGVFGDSIQIPTGNLPPVDVAVDTSMPNMEAMRRKDRDEDEETLYAGGPPEIQPADGVPLPRAARERYERLFGHDFSHVRVHSGRAADLLTRYYRAHALTSGSHIFLSRSMPTGSARTEPVLRHELAHVLQQTGSRPLSVPVHAHQPVLGRPGRGLRHDERREAAADRMVWKASHRGKQPVVVEEEGGLGLYPATSSNVAKAVTNEMLDEEITESIVHQVRSLATIPDGGGRGFTAATRAGEAIWRTVKGFLTRTTAMSGVGARHNTAPFETSDALGAISAWFRRNNDVATYIRQLTYYSRRVKTDSSVELDRRKFLENLEVYILGSTGVNVSIDRPPLTTSDETAWSPQYAVVQDIDLGFANANSNIYTVMKTNTDTAMGANRFSQEHWWIVREQLKGEELPAPPWHATEYRLSDNFVAQMRVLIQALGTGNVGPWSDYINIDDLGSGFGGLRVATHGQLTGSGARQGRQSHHVPQFLLVEFFENSSDVITANVAHRVGGSLMFPPGFQVSAGNATRFEAGGHRIDFSTLNGTSGRGDGIPAVSLAARTHQRGRLHLNAASEWGVITRNDQAITQPTDSDIEFRGTMAQGVRINLTFYESFLKRRLHAANMPGTVTRTGDILDHVNRNPRPEYETATYEAIRDTYRWMYNGMISSLRLALANESLEATEYSKSARLQPNTITSDGELVPAYRPHVTAMSAVVTAVEAKNAAIMAQWRRGG